MALVISIAALILGCRIKEDREGPIHLTQDHYSGNPTFRSMPLHGNFDKLTKEDVRRIVIQAATDAGYNVAEFVEPDIRFTRERRRWSAFFQDKPPARPGMHFFVALDGGTNEITVMPGE